MYVTSGGLVGINTSNPNANLDVYGTISATNFVGDGSGLTGVTAGATDRIVSGSTGGTRMVAISETGYISITQAGANSGWFDPTRGLVTLGVSSTGPISGTRGYFRGNVGIGSLLPLAALQISGSDSRVYAPVSNTADHPLGAGQASLWIQNSAQASGAGAFLLLASNDSANRNNMGYFGAISTDGSRTPSLVFGQRTGSMMYSERMRLAPSGNFGVNTTSPLAKLDVAGTISASDAIQVGSSSLACGAGIAGALRYADGNIEYCNGTAWAAMVGAADAMGDRIVSGTTNVTAHEDRSITFTTAGAQRAVIGANGRVGIGTDNPTRELSVSGSGLAGVMSVANYSAGHPVRITHFDAPALTSGQAGYIQVGVSSTTRNAGSWSFVYDGPGSTLNRQDFNFYGVVQPNLSLAANGNVGIGTTAPELNLDVSGSARLTGPAPRLVFNELDTGVSWTLVQDGGSIGFRHQTTPGSPVLSVAHNMVTVGTNEVAGGSSLTVPGGEVQVSSSGAACSAANSGAIRYESGNLFFCNASNVWVQLGTAGGGQEDRIVSGTTNAIAWQDGSLTISTAGIERMVVAANGNVGIGTLLPEEVLSLRVNSTGDITPLSIGWQGTPAMPATVGIVLGKSANTGGKAGIFFERRESFVSGDLLFAVRNSSDLTPVTAADEVMRIKRLGRVGIQTQSPTSTLEVSGSFSVSGSQAGTSPAFFVSTDGRAGVGTNVLNMPFTVQSPVASNRVYLGHSMEGFGPGTNNAGAIYFGSSPNPSVTNTTAGIEASWGGTTTPQIHIGTLRQNSPTFMSAYYTGELTFSTRGSERMRITNSGVGIGTANPLAVLDARTTADGADGVMARTISGTGYMSLRPNGVDGNVLRFGGSGPAANILRFLGPSDAERMRIAASGMVGIGTTAPSTTLHVNGHVFLPGVNRLVFGDYVSTSNYGPWMAYSSGNNSLDIVSGFNMAGGLGTNGIRFGLPSGSTWNVFATLAGNGNFGIRTTTPNATLDVAGTISASDAIQVGTSSLACSGGIPGAIRYNGGNLQYCNGSAWTTLGGGGGGSLGTLSDVELTNLTGRDYLRYDSVAGKWVNISETAAMSTTTMVDGWPDAILCKWNDGGTWRDWIFYSAINGPTEKYYFSTTGVTDQTRTLRYSLATKGYHSTDDGGTIDCAANGWGIAELYANGRAFNFIGNSGQGESGTALGDRIASGTLAVIANSTTSIVSLSTNGTTWGYLNSGNSYLPTVTATKVSSTNVSATYLQLSSPTTVLACNAGLAGSMRYTSGTMQVCDGSNWGNIGIGVPTGTIAAFAASSCPAGWTEYAASRGRFLRGIDNGAGNDPAGTRAPGNAQGDAAPNITGALTGGTARPIVLTASGAFTTTGSLYSAGPEPGSANRYEGVTFSASNSNAKYGAADEIRPKNVAVTFCMYSGFQSAPGQTILTTLASLTDVSVAGAQAGQVLAFDGASWVASDTTGGGSALGDRIVSGTHEAVINESSGYVSLSTGGTTWGYFGAASSYLPALVSERVSASHVSATAIHSAGALGAGTTAPLATVHVSGSLLVAGNDNKPCQVGMEGLIRRNASNGRMEICE